MKKIWEGYKSTLEALGRFNLTVISFLVYFLLFPIVRAIFVFSRKPKNASAWAESEPPYANSHEHQF